MEEFDIEFQRTAFNRIQGSDFIINLCSAYETSRDNFDFYAIMKMQKNLKYTKYSNHRFYESIQDMKNMCYSLFKTCLEGLQKIDSFHETDLYITKAECGGFCVEINVYEQSVRIIYIQESSYGYFDSESLKQEC